MTAARLLRPRSGLHADPRAGRFLGAYLLSLLLHALLLFGLSGAWQSSVPREDKPPVYFIDLVHKPVLNPQAGRPEPRTVPPAVPATPSETMPAKASVPTKPAAAAKVPAKPANSHVSEALQKLRDEQARQLAIDRLRQAQTVPMDTPVGLPDAKGNEAGIVTDVYVQATIQQNWALSPYVLGDPAKMARIEAWVRITYSKSGRLESFRFEKESGDRQFDESIKRALVKSQQLPNSLPVRLEDIRVIFNLKQLNLLAETRR